MRLVLHGNAKLCTNAYVSCCCLHPLQPTPPEPMQVDKPKEEATAGEAAAPEGEKKLSKNQMKKLAKGKVSS